MSSHVQDITMSTRVDGDEALKIVSSEGGIAIDERTNRRLRWKADLIILPLMCLVIAFCLVDKVAIGYGSILGMIDDLHLTTSQFSWIAGIWEFGYIVTEWPSVYLCQRLPIAKFCGVCIIAFGIICACFAATHDFAGAMVARTFIGVAEGSIYPAFTFITGRWYRANEQFIRTAWWFGSYGLGQLLGSWFAYGIHTNAEGMGFALSQWRMMYVIVGCCIVVLGLIFILMVPDNQINAWWLSPEDRMLAVERVRVNQQGIGNRHFKRYQFFETLRDPMTWCISGFGLLQGIPFGGLTNFFGIIIQSYGYDLRTTILFGGIPGAVTIAMMLLIGYLGELTHNRMYVGLIPPLLGLVGGIILLVTPLEHYHTRLAGFFLANMFVVTYMVVVSLVSTNVAGATKKTTVSALLFILSSVGYIIGPQTFRSGDAPGYKPAVITLIVCYGCSMGIMIFIIVWYLLQNKRKEKQRAMPGYVKVLNQEFLDLTDRENPEFVYTL